MAAYRNNLIEQVKNLKRVASTVYDFGDFVMDNGLGQIIPLTPTKKVEGINLMQMDATNPYFALANYDLPIDGAAVTIDRFLVEVTGTATAAMQGSDFNVDATDPGKIAVGTYHTMFYDTLAVGVFAVAETITGTTSGATAVVSQVIGADTLVVTTIVGTFALGETITGGTSGATARLRLDVTGGVQFKMERFITASLCEFSILPTAAV